MCKWKRKKIWSYLVTSIACFWLVACGELGDLLEGDNKEEITAFLKEVNQIATNKGWIKGDKGELFSVIPAGYSDDNFRLFGLEFLPGECSVKQKLPLAALGLIDEPNMQNFYAEKEDNDDIFRWSEPPRCFMCLYEQVQQNFSIKDDYNLQKQVGLNLKKCPCSFLTKGEDKDKGSSAPKQQGSQKGPENAQEAQKKVSSSGGNLSADIKAYLTNSEGQSLVIDYGFVANSDSPDGGDVGIGVSLVISKPASKTCPMGDFEMYIRAQDKNQPAFGSANKCYQEAGDNCSEVHRARLNVACDVDSSGAPIQVMNYELQGPGGGGDKLVNGNFKLASNGCVSDGYFVVEDREMYNGQIGGKFRVAFNSNNLKYEKEVDDTFLNYAGEEFKKSAEIKQSSFAQCFKVGAYEESVINYRIFNSDGSAFDRDKFGLEFETEDGTKQGRCDQWGCWLHYNYQDQTNLNLVSHEMPKLADGTKVCKKDFSGGVESKSCDYTYKKTHIVVRERKLVERQAYELEGSVFDYAWFNNKSHKVKYENGWKKKDQYSDTATWSDLSTTDIGNNRIWLWDEGTYSSIILMQESSAIKAYIQVERVIHPNVWGSELPTSSYRCTSYSCPSGSDYISVKSLAESKKNNQPASFEWIELISETDYNSASSAGCSDYWCRSERSKTRYTVEVQGSGDEYGGFAYLEKNNVPVEFVKDTGLSVDYDGNSYTLNCYGSECPAPVKDVPNVTDPMTGLEIKVKQAIVSFPDGTEVKSAGTVIGKLKQARVQRRMKKADDNECTALVLPEWQVLTDSKTNAGGW